MIVHVSTQQGLQMRLDIPPTETVAGLKLAIQNEIQNRFGKTFAPEAQLLHVGVTDEEREKMCKAACSPAVIAQRAIGRVPGTTKLTEVGIREGTQVFVLKDFKATMALSYLMNNAYT